MTEIPFAPFDKIAERPAQWELEESALRKLARVPWVVTEKIHGANFVLVIDERGIHAAKRKQLLGPEDDFFGHPRLLSRLRSRLFALAEAAREGRDDVAAVLVYGEIFGGAYPHPDVSRVPGVEPVQTGIWYAPDVEFCAFDLALALRDQRDLQFQDQPRLHALATASGLLVAEPLAVCSYRDALAFPERFSSTLPARFGLPPLPGLNLAEGVVLRPQPALVFDTPKGRVRPLLKKKIAEFSEDERFAGARPWARPVQTGEPLLDRLEREACVLLTPARLDAAVSKVGRLSGAGARDLLLEELLSDLWEELARRLPGEVARLAPDERALLSEILRDQAASLVSSR